jgi:hypothetical protein
MVKTAAAAMSKKDAKLSLIRFISGFLPCGAGGVTFRKTTSQTVYPAMNDSHEYRGPLGLEISAGKSAL